MSDAAPAAGARRPKRERSLRESLLSIVLGMEAAVVFFGTLVVFGLRILDAAPAFVGGAAFLVLLVLAAGVQRWTAGVIAGGVLQIALIATGILVPAMYVVGALFAAFWLWCLLRARQIETQQLEARRAAALAAHGNRPEGE